MHAIDIDKRAVANTLSNAFRNGVADRVSGEQVDLYPWDPEHRYDVVVASLYQMPNDPFQQLTSHRPLDYWGRGLFDHLLSLLPQLLEPDGRAYLMQLSILSQRETLKQLAGEGPRRGEWSTSASSSSARCSVNTLNRSAASRSSPTPTTFDFGDVNMMIAYLIEITRENGSTPRERRVAS